MYALIENKKVIRVFDTHIDAVENGWSKDRQIIETNKNHLFYLDGGAVVIGELSEVNEGEFEIFTDECSYQLSKVDYWQPIGWQPIGAWLSF